MAMPMAMQYPMAGAMSMAGAVPGTTMVYMPAAAMGGLGMSAGGNGVSSLHAQMQQGNLPSGAGAGAGFLNAGQQTSGLYRNGGML
jgi:hypothetical protein